MSGHSRWAQIHRQKGTVDAKRGNLFTKLGNAITIAARQGGGNPEANFKLRLAIDQAHAANLPKENIERAIKRGTGELGAGQIEEITYEGFGPAGIAIIIECLTDNHNRTSADIKHIFSRHGGSLGAPNSVMWMFEKVGVVRIDKIDENLELELIDQGAIDIKKNEELVTIYCQPQDLQKIKKVLEDRGIKIEMAEIELIAKDKKNITDSSLKAQIEQLLEALDNQDEVNNYYTNAEV